MITLGIMALTYKFRTQLLEQVRGLTKKYILKTKRVGNNENEL